MYARVPQATAQFVLKIELLSHIMGTTPILEMARAYGLRPRMRLLTIVIASSARRTFASSLIDVFSIVLRCFCFFELFHVFNVVYVYL